MPLYKFTYETRSKATYYVEVDDPEILKEYVSTGENPTGLDFGPSHNAENSTTIVELEELIGNSVK